MTALLEIHDLSTHFYMGQHVVKAVDHLSLSLHEGETLGIVGESGSGKTMTALSIMRLVPQPAGKIVSGEIRFKGENLLEKGEEEIRQIRGKEIAMILQDPMTSLNPVIRVGEQVAEVSVYHERFSMKSAWEKAVKMLEMVHIPLPHARARDYPHQFSGGMRQRVVIAMALACRSSLLIADEPTTALDVTIQAQVLELMKDLQRQLNTAIILITHDLALIAEICDSVAVMYGGRLVEYGSVKTIFKAPRHPYTRSLLACIPRLDDPGRRLTPVEGFPPSLINPPQVCLFHPRCRDAMEICRQEVPGITKLEEDHTVNCFLYTPSPSPLVGEGRDGGR